MKMEDFDLLEYQKTARQTTSAKELFLLWDKVSCFYERGRISAYELEEMKEVIWPHLRKLNSIRVKIDSALKPS